MSSVIKKKKLAQTLLSVAPSESHKYFSLYTHFLYFFDIQDSSIISIIIFNS